MSGTTSLTGHTGCAPPAMTGGPGPPAVAADWLPRCPADLFGLDPADPPELPMTAPAPLGITVLIPTCLDPAGRRQESLLATLRSLTVPLRQAGLPVAAVIAADGLPPSGLARLERGWAALGCPGEVLPLGPLPGAVPPGECETGSAAAARNHALRYLASLPARSPLRLRYLLFLDDDSTITPAAVQALVAALESHQAAIAACPAIVPVTSLASWRPPAPSRPGAFPLPGPWRGGEYDLLSVTSHGSLVTGRVVGLLVRAAPVLPWIAGGGRLFCPATPRRSSEDMLAMAALAALGPLLAVPQAHAADLARGTPASTRQQQLRWGYDHAWLARALSATGLLAPGVRTLVWQESQGWQEVQTGDGLTGVLVNPAQLGVLSGMLSAAASRRETAVAMAGPDAESLAAAAALLAATLRWWQETAPAGRRRPRPDLPGRIPDDWAELRHGLDSQLAHVAGNALGTLPSVRDSRGLPRHLVFGLRQRERNRSASGEPAATPGGIDDR